jgi:hypothetical protein
LFSFTISGSGTISGWGVPLTSTACSRGGERCAYCGMKIDAASPWRADLVRADASHVRFDTPRCAFLAWRTGRVAATGIELQEYYDRTWRKGEDLRFAFGSDVLGPMGAEVVPVDPSRAEKFARDHSATKVAPLSEVTAALLAPAP